MGELVGGAERHQAPVVDDRDAVGELLGLVEQVGGEHDRDPVRPQLSDVLPRRPAGGRVEPGGRLVEEQHLGSTDDRQRERQPLLLPTGEVPEPGPARVVEPDAFEQVVRVERIAVVGREQPQHLGGPGERVDAALLQHQTRRGDAALGASRRGSSPSTRTDPASGRR